MSWNIDYNHSGIQFAVRHMMVSNVRGQFEKFSGDVAFDEQHPANSSISLEIDAASINTRNGDRDAHLRSPDFLDAANYPTITFQSKKVQKVDDSHGKIVGDLTIRGLSKEVTLNVDYHGQAPNPFAPMVAAGFSGTTTINRKDWGLTWNAAIETGGVVVGDELKVSFEVELVKQLETAPASA